MIALVAGAAAFVPAAALTGPSLGMRLASRRPALLHPTMAADARSPVAAAAAGALAFSLAQSASAARSGGRVGGRVGGGGGGALMRSGRVQGGGATNVYVAPPMFSPFGFSPFGFSPFGFSPFGFGFGFGLPGPLLLFALGGLALTSFRSVRGLESGSSDEAGAAYCLQIACYCQDRQDSLFGRLQNIAQRADTQVRPDGTPPLPALCPAAPPARAASRVDLRGAAAARVGRMPCDAPIL